MIHMWFTGINYYKLAVEKDRDSVFTTITTIWKPGTSKQLAKLGLQFPRPIFQNYRPLTN